MNTLQRDRMRLVLSAVVASSLTLGVATAGADEKVDPKKLLTRSVYVPVVFAVSPELGEIKMTVVGEGFEFAPRPRTFLFTYYPEHEKFLPEVVEVRIRTENACADEAPLNFFITPLGFQSGGSSFAHSRKELEKLSRSRSRDVRLTPRVVKLRCPKNESEQTTDP